MASPRKMINELVVAIAADGVTATNSGVDGTTFDRYQAGNPVHDYVALCDVGLWATDGSYVFKLQESANGSSWSDVAAAEVLVRAADVDGGDAAGESAGTVVIDGLADDNQTFLMSYLGDQRYVRAAVAVTGATTGSLADVRIFNLGANPRDAIGT